MVNAVPERRQTMKPKTGRILVIFTAVLTLLPPQKLTAQAAECIFAFLQEGNAARFAASIHSESRTPKDAKQLVSHSASFFVFAYRRTIPSANVMV